MLVNKQNSIRTNFKDMFVLPSYIYVLSIFLLFHQSSLAQINGQLWEEYLLTYTISPSFKTEGRVGYRSNTSGPKWETLEVRLMPEKKLNKHFDVLGTFQYFRTINESHSNTSEIREGLGLRIHFSPDFRIHSKLLLRVEQRNIYTDETTTWKHSTRGRIRAELQGPINKSSMKGDNIWYGLTDLEFFLLVDETVKERYPNRARVRCGLGYKLNQTWDFEVIYMWQLSTKAYHSEEESVDNILRFRIKQTIGRTKKESIPKSDS